MCFSYAFLKSLKLKFQKSNVLSVDEGFFNSFIATKAERNSSESEQKLGRIEINFLRGSNFSQRKNNL